MKIQAMVASDEVDASGEKFSKESLERMAKTEESAPIRITGHGDALGSVTRTWKEGNYVFAEGNLHVSMEALERIEKLVEDDKACLVPMISFDEEGRHLDGDVMVIDVCRVEGFLITPRPMDTTLLPIKVIDG